MLDYVIYLLQYKQRIDRQGVAFSLVKTTNSTLLDYQYSMSIISG